MRSIQAIQVPNDWALWAWDVLSVVQVLGKHVFFCACAPGVSFFVLAPLGRGLKIPKPWTLNRLDASHCLVSHLT